jgi:CDP-diacylglycerol--glycerol-3-phosphate 3-phosphatidyltransferase
VKTILIFPRFFVILMHNNVVSLLARSPMNVPNSLTLLRILFAIIIFTMIGLWRFDLALLFFILAALTDSLDGWWARRFNQVTVFGRIMDPFADKFLICGVFICLVAIPEMTYDKTGYPAWLMLQPWMVLVIIGRELLVTSLRAFVEGAGGDFSSKWIGKLKMVFQCAAIILALLYLSGGAQWYVVAPDGREMNPRAFMRDDTAVQENLRTASATPSNLRPEIAAQEPTVLAQTLDRTLGTVTWRMGVCFSMLAAFWLTFGITLLSGLDYCIHAARMIRKQHERQHELEELGVES